MILNYHVRVGNITKPKKCLNCGKIKKLEAHHEDYAKPLIVEWKCRTCHANYHHKVV